MQSLNFKAIGYFHSQIENANEAPRQPNPELNDTSGVILLNEGLNMDEALRDLDGFSKIWVLFHFHKNDHWNPTVMPPRGSQKKRGVFATRSPYRPNPIGMSVLDLLSVSGRKIDVGPSDLLNGTPVLDIKPYLPYADSFPEAKIGWLKDNDQAKYSIVWSPLSLKQLSFLEQQGVTQLKGFAINQLEYEPDDDKKKRIYRDGDFIYLAYRTWRLEIRINSSNQLVTIDQILSGYSQEEIASAMDLYNDKSIHRAFNSVKF